METIVANLGKAERRTRGGREFLVANATLIVPGVLAGSRGPVFYSPEETGRRVNDWDGMPWVIRHPVVNGQFKSARDPDIAEAYEAGRNYRTKYTGKLASEAWFDVEQLRRVAPSVLNALNRGDKIEISTGLFVDLEPAPDGATHNGRPYQFIAKNFRPDHIAILPDSVGACSNRDGCGINNADEPSPTADPPTEEPVMANKLTPEDRKRIVVALVANCDCGGAALPWKGKDEATLNALSDDVLQTMEDTRKALATNVATPPGPPTGHIVWNAQRNVYEVQPGQATVNTATPAPAPVAQPVTAPVATPVPTARQLTEDEWLALAPTKSKAVWNSVKDAHARMVANLVEQLVENVKDEDKETMRAFYAKQTEDDLRIALRAQPPRQDKQDQPRSPVYNWLGASGAPASIPDDVPVLSLPKYTPKRK